MSAAAGAEYSTGRRPWGIANTGFVVGRHLGEHDSQYLLDPYTFALPSWRDVLCPAFNRIAELAGNLAAGHRYWSRSRLGSSGKYQLHHSAIRAETVSLNYFGDSIMNSMTDILACILGFILASRLPVRLTVIGTIAIEVNRCMHPVPRDDLTLIYRNASFTQVMPSACGNWADEKTGSIRLVAGVVYDSNVSRTEWTASRKVGACKGLNVVGAI